MTLPPLLVPKLSLGTRRGGLPMPIFTIHELFRIEKSNPSVMYVPINYGEVEGEEHLLQQVCFLKISRKK